MSQSPLAAADVRETLAALHDAVASALQGKPRVVRLALTALLGRGHLLVEDVPGVGKTTLASALARVVGGKFTRLQFTADLMPSDLTGVSIFDSDAREFTFRSGPIFTNVLLADEINRAMPKTQSAMLEAMSEQRVTVDGVTRRLPEPYFVVATQNPLDQHGTFPLPESQLDRFLLRLSIGYPGADDERRILAAHRWSDGLLSEAVSIEAAVDPEGLVALQERAERVRATDPLLGYVVAIADATRQHPDVAIGASPRGSLALMRAAKAWALIDGRDFVVPDDVKTVAPSVLAHRLVAAGGDDPGRETTLDVIRDVLAAVPVPR
ncbi:MAG: MoxR family ATPase [Acidobacteriota bacterium]|nr:MoxR family ATPase [Acidobacteriota bacterium]